jgi:hypothetical protein
MSSFSRGGPTEDLRGDRLDPFLHAESAAVPPWDRISGNHDSVGKPFLCTARARPHHTPNEAESLRADCKASSGGRCDVTACGSTFRRLVADCSPKLRNNTWAGSFACLLILPVCRHRRSPDRMSITCRILPGGEACPTCQRDSRASGTILVRVRPARGWAACSCDPRPPKHQHNVYDVRYTPNSVAYDVAVSNCFGKVLCVSLSRKCVVMQRS